MDFCGKKVLVVGLARSGIAAAALLSRLGACVTVNDSKKEEDLLEPIDEIKTLPNLRFCLGQAALPLLEGQEMLVLSPGIPDTVPFVKKAREMGINVIGEMELGYETLKGSVVAITGTNGKTTTTTLTGEIFKAFHKKTFVTGNIGLPTTSVSLESQKEDVHVIEVSSFQLETIKHFRPQASAILNITEDHLNRHGTMEAYIAMKERIFENQRQNDVCVLNADDPLLRMVPAHVPCRVAYFSRLKEVPFGAFVKGDAIYFKSYEGEESLICKTEEVKIPGLHNLENALAAAALTLCMGVDAQTVAQTLRTFSGVEHRIEFVRKVNGITYINDSKGTNVDSTLKAIDTMKTPTVILLGGSEKKANYLPLARAIKHSQVVACVTLGDTAKEITLALEEEKISPIVQAGYDFEKAIELASSLCPKGGTVLLSPACASFDMFVDFEQRGEVFKDLVHRIKEEPLK